MSDTESFTAETLPTEREVISKVKPIAEIADSRQNEILVTNIDKLTTKESLIASFYQQNRPKASIEHFIDQHFGAGLSDFDMPEVHLSAT